MLPSQALTIHQHKQTKSSNIPGHHQKHNNKIWENPTCVRKEEGIVILLPGWPHPPAWKENYSTFVWLSMFSDQSFSPNIWRWSLSLLSSSPSSSSSFVELIDLDSVRSEATGIDPDIIIMVITIMVIITWTVWGALPPTPGSPTTSTSATWAWSRWRREHVDEAVEDHHLHTDQLSKNNCKLKWQWRCWKSCWQSEDTT